MWLLSFHKSPSLNHIYKNITELHPLGRKIGLVTRDLSLSFFSVSVNSIISSYFFFFFSPASGGDKEREKGRAGTQTCQDFLSRLNKSNVTKLGYIPLERPSRTTRQRRTPSEWSKRKTGIKPDGIFFLKWVHSEEYPKRVRIVEGSNPATPTT